jgi:hypothetical protein
MTRETIYLAALLHDIGKFWQRADENGSAASKILSAATKNNEGLYCPQYNGRYSHKHVLWTAEFLDLHRKFFERLIEPDQFEAFFKASVKHHAPDKDDGHSAAADRTILESMFGADWLSNHAVAVSGTYGLNKNTFNTASDAVMDATWSERGGWIPADRDWSAAVELVFKRWLATLQAGGDVFVKEGGQSDFTAKLVTRLQEEYPGINPQKRIHVVQHSDWNENMTTPEALTYTRANTNYIRIRDANRYLRRKGPVESFETAATQHPVFSQAWRAAFDYFSPSQLLDFSDTGELMHILGMGEMGIDEFRMRFLDDKKMPNMP